MKSRSRKNVSRRGREACAKAHSVTGGERGEGFKGWIREEVGGLELLKDGVR